MGLHVGIDTQVVVTNKPAFLAGPEVEELVVLFLPVDWSTTSVIKAAVLVPATLPPAAEPDAAVGGVLS